MIREERDCSGIAYHLALSTTHYLNAVVAAASGKGPEQRLELNDSEISAANFLLTIAAKRTSLDFLQDPAVVHLLALAEFWKDICSDEQIESLQVEMNDRYKCWLANNINKDILETVGNLFSALGQDNDAELVGELACIYMQWVRNLNITNYGNEWTLAILTTRPSSDYTVS